ncbi:MAG: PRC-barrel domain-containing protein [Candidatus Brockarchaeota archaeon]|nr:PRC-barrel domain-containing protein [Candidatus Brockarchaeota archaeon]
MLIRKEKIIGLQVYDKKGRYVGTVKDIGFVLGENLVGIVVVGRDNREMEFIWSEVEAAEDIVILKKEVAIPTATPPPKKPVAESREEIRAVLKEQPVVTPTMPMEKQPSRISSEAEVQIAPKSGAGEVSELQVPFKEEMDYMVSEQGEVPGTGVHSFEAGRVEEEGATSNTKTCPKCGAINNARYKFCFRCGTRLS